jgi:aspartate ammonia-lyase
MNKYYSIETEKALHSFGKEITPHELIKAYGEVKKATISAQQHCFSLYNERVFQVLMETTDEIIEGRHKDQFPLPLRQGGAGTSLHMNINEVIAGISNFKLKSENLSVDPLEDLARFQSTNDTLSTALTIMVYRQLEQTEALIIGLQETLIKGESRYDHILMTGRTELQDALPITLGQVFGGWAGSIERDRWRLHKLKERLRTIALGGTAMGTCFSAPRKYVFKAEKILRQITGLPLCRSQNLTDEISSKDNLAEVASGFQLVALNLRKMSNDLLLYTSSFCGELHHKELQYGSTIMPYKSNPVLLEYTKGLSISIKHECMKISDYASEGQMQLNAFIPFMAESFIAINTMMNSCLTTFIKGFFPTMEVNEKRIEENLSTSPALVNTLRQVIGYENVKKLVPLIQEKKPLTLIDLKLLISQETSLTPEFLDRWFDPSNLTSYSDPEKENT